MVRPERGGERIFVSGVLAFGNGPSTEIFLRPEGSSGVEEEDLGVCVGAAVEEQACGLFLSGQRRFSLVASLEPQLYRPQWVIDNLKVPLKKRKGRLLGLFLLPTPCSLLPAF
jgi:hypothetical protein